MSPVFRGFLVLVKQWTMAEVKTLIIVGGGAAGFFCAAQFPFGAFRVIILEKGTQVLGKVKVSGGGRCNVTHACFEPAELVRYYPRGGQALRGPFHHFQPADTIEWFASRGVPVKTEEDGRVFPVSDNSQSVIDCLMETCRAAGVEVRTRTGVDDLLQTPEGWEVVTDKGERLRCNCVLVSTGSSNRMWELLGRLGHTLIAPVPSLFTFHVSDPRLAGLAGVAVNHAVVSLEGTRLSASGPLLITHQGISGPAVLKLSAWAAREMARLAYEFTVRINWDSRFNREQLTEFLREWKHEHARQQVLSHSPVRMPHRLWCALAEAAGTRDLRWGDVPAKNIEKLVTEVCSGFFPVQGKSTFKEEFVTAGGIKLDEVDFRTMESKKFSGLYFAGEVLDIDAVTGGFNFQAAWTTAVVAARAMQAGRTGRKKV